MCVVGVPIYFSYRVVRPSLESVTILTTASGCVSHERRPACVAHARRPDVQAHGDTRPFASPRRPTHPYFNNAAKLGEGDHQA